MLALSKNGWNKAGIVEKAVIESLRNKSLRAISLLDETSGWGEKLSYGNTSKSGTNTFSLFKELDQALFKYSELLQITKFFW